MDDKETRGLIKYLTCILREKDSDIMYREKNNDILTPVAKFINSFY